jgi:chromosome segregation ATPase
VFSKYYALYPSTKPATGKRLEDPIERELLEREPNNAIADLQLQVRALNARFDEMESERTEPNQLRTDLENLQRLLHESLELTSSRLDEFEKHLGNNPGAPARPEGDAADNSRIISELQNQLLELREQVREMQRLLEQLQQNRTTEEPQGTLVHDVHAIRENLDHLFSLINKSTDPRP